MQFPVEVVVEVFVCLILKLKNVLQLLYFFEFDGVVQVPLNPRDFIILNLLLTNLVMLPHRLEELSDIRSLELLLLLLLAITTSPILVKFRNVDAVTVAELVQ